jgi:sphinganine-1-phosphate aldolase
MVPFAGDFVDQKVSEDVAQSIREIFPAEPGDPEPVLSLPAKGSGFDEVMGTLAKLKAKDDRCEGKTFAYVYLTDKNSDHHRAIEEASRMFMHENALNPTVFKSLRRMEVEVVSMLLRLVNAPAEAAGTLTSGGTESVLMAVKTWRDHARLHRPGVVSPNLVCVSTVHPAFEKAGHYFDVGVVHTPPGPDYACDVAAMERAIDGNTILLVVSAPQYPHGIIDHVEAVCELARRRGLPVHVDACVGGMMLPFVERLGHEVRPWDFRVPGVSSMSVDIHKYGYAPKGSSVCLFRDPAVRRLQFFQYATWPGGLFVSPSMTGSRGGGPIAAAWASLVTLGESGFLKLMGDALQAKAHILAEIKKTVGLEVIGNPQGTCISFRASQTSEVDLSIYAVGEALEERGWKVDRQQLPPSIHLTVMPAHFAIKEKFATDLRDSVEAVRKDPAKYSQKGTAAMYGFVAKLPDESLVDKILNTFMHQIYSPSPQ